METENHFAPPIPTVVDVNSTDDEDDIDEMNITKLQYGAATPGTMATAPTTPSSASLGFGSPFSVFASFAASSSNLFDDERNEKDSTTEVTTGDNEEENVDGSALGITKPTYNINYGKEENELEQLIGIEAPNYSVPEGDIPLSAFDLFNEKKKVKKVAPVTREENDDDGDYLWQFKAQNQYPERIEEGDETDEASSSDVDITPDNVDRTVHNQTAEGHYLFNSRPVDAPLADLKYSLKDGKKSLSRVQREFSKPKNMKTRPNVAKSKEDSGSSRAEASYKIFLLLLAPKAKIFEIIQVFFNPRQATIGHILNLIPANATEPALAAQSYVGLCRPNDGIHLKMGTMASLSYGNYMCARITKGEILVAIPHGYSADICAKLAKPILGNKRVTKLMDRNDPLSKIKKKKKKKKRSSETERRKDDYKSIAVVAPTATTETSKGERQHHSVRTGKKEDELLDRVIQNTTENNSQSDNGSGVPALIKSNSISEESGSCNTPGSDLIHGKNNNRRKILAPSVEVWETNMSLKSDYSVASASITSTASVDQFLSRGKPQRSTSQLPTIPAISPIDKTNKEKLNNGMVFTPVYLEKGVSESSNKISSNRVREACATIIQSAVRRILTLNRAKKLYPNSLPRSIISSSADNEHFSRLHHVCAIIIQCHARSLIAKSCLGKLKIVQ